MESFLLKRWEAIEIFCKIVDRSNERPKRSNTEKTASVWSNTHIDYYTDKFSTDKASEEFSDKNFDGSHINLMKALSEGIIGRIPFTFSENRLRFALKHIQKGEGPENIQHELKNYTKYIKEPLDDKQRKFEDTDWWIYYHSTLDDADKTDVISKAVLSISPFGRAKITRPLLPDEKADEETQVYIGEYSIYGRRNDMIKFSLKTEDGDRDLSILIYVGDKVQALSIGTYTNQWRAMSAGKLVLSRIEEKTILEKIRLKKEKTLVDFMPIQSDKINNVEPAITDFLSRKENVIDVKMNITTIELLKNWVNSGYITED